VSNKPRNAWFWFVTWWPVVAAIGVIAVESTSIMGSDHTTGPLRWLWEHLFGHVKEQTWELFHHLLRKSGHFIGYGLVGLTWLRAWRRMLPQTRFFTDAGLALLATAVLASADEWHQAFLPNRGSSPWDVLLDCCGSLALQLIVYLYWRIAQPRRLAHAA
jgi:VanZ family protein